MESTKWHRMLVEAIKTENVIKQVELVNNEREIETLEAKLKICKKKSKELKEIINLNEIEILKITSDISREEKRLSEQPTNTLEKRKSLSIGESSQQDNPHTTQGDNEQRNEELYSEDEEALEQLSPYVHDGSYYYDTMDSDLEDAIINYMENW